MVEYTMYTGKMPLKSFQEQWDAERKELLDKLIDYERTTMGQPEQNNKVGIKFDQGKPRMELLPPELMVEVAKVLTFGAEKYEARNWEKGMDWGRIYGSLQRHLNAWASGEDTDPETGLSHLAHAGCNIAFLLAYTQRGVGDDSRYKTTTGS